MKWLCFKDTDTLLFLFSDERTVDYIDLDYQSLLELNCDGNAVALTIEHAREHSILPTLDFVQIPTRQAWREVDGAHDDTRRLSPGHGSGVSGQGFRLSGGR